MAGVTFEWHGPEFTAALEAAAVQGLNKAAELLLASSQELTPVDTGNLRRSGAVQEATPGAYRAWVSYDTSYAVPVHEHTNWHFNTSKNPQAQAKFLETPLVRDKDKLVGVIAATLSRTTG